MNLPEHVKQAALAAIEPTTRDEYIQRMMDSDAERGMKKSTTGEIVYPSDAKKLAGLAKELSKNPEYLKLEQARHDERENEPLDPNAYYAKEGPAAIALRAFVKKTLDGKDVAENDQIFITRALNYSDEMMRPWPGTQPSQEKKKDGIER